MISASAVRRFFLHRLTVLMVIFVLSGCAAIQPDLQGQQTPDDREVKKDEPQLQEQAEQPEVPADPAEAHLSAAADLISNGDIEGALRENQKALARAGKQSPGDEALYNMGLVYMHYRNTQKNYEKARAQFERLLREYPDSPLAEEARIWSGVLQVIEKLKQVDLEIEEKKKELSR